MKNKLENLLSFDDFNSTWNSEQAKTTKRTQTGLDILKENSEDGIEEIIPAGTLESDIESNYENDDEKIEKIKSFLDDADEDTIEAIVNELRDVLLEMEQQGFIDTDTTDKMDDDYEDDWVSWSKAAIELPDFPEEGLNNILEIIESSETLEFGQIGGDEEESEDKSTFEFDDEEDELEEDEL